MYSITEKNTSSNREFMFLEIAYTDVTDMDGTEQFDTVDRLDNPDFDSTVVELQDSNQYYEYEDAYVQVAKSETPFSLGLQYEPETVKKLTGVIKVESIHSKIRVEFADGTESQFPQYSSIMWIQSDSRSSTKSK